MQYKVSFFFTAAGQFLVAFVTFLSVSFLFERSRVWPARPSNNSGLNVKFSMQHL
jgi:hypothetical protein